MCPYSNMKLKRGLGNTHQQPKQKSLGLTLTYSQDVATKVPTPISDDIADNTYHDFE